MAHPGWKLNTCRSALPGLRGLAGWSLLILALAISPASSAADKPQETLSPSPTRDGLRDMTTAVRAGKALYDDDQLRPLNLRVEVKSGVATVYGPVPSAELIQRAIKTLEQVPGVLKVRSQMRLVKARPRSEPLRFPLDPEPPTQSASASPDPVSGALGTLTGRNPVVPAPAVPNKPREPGPPSAQGAVRRAQPASNRPGTVTLLAPVAMSSPPRQDDTVRTPAAPSPPVLAGSLPGAIDRLRQGDERYRAIRTEVQGGTVLLLPGDAPGEHVMAFAQVLTRLPGVERVVVRNGSPAPH